MLNIAIYYYFCYFIILLFIVIVIVSGIVDFLQDWSLRKQIERLLKVYVARKDPDGLSVMAPEPYKARFQANLLQIFDVPRTDGLPTVSHPQV